MEGFAAVNGLKRNWNEKEKRGSKKKGTKRTDNDIWNSFTFCIIVEGCILFGLPRVPTQISRERVVLPLLRAGRKLCGRPAGNGWDLEYYRKGVNTRS